MVRQRTLDLYAQKQMICQHLLEVSYDKREADSLSKHLLAAIYGKQPLYPGQQLEVSASQQKELGLALRRLKQGEPLQYVLECTSFMGMDFHVTPAVLIPRKETEELVSRALILLLEIPKARVLEIGTGSGCVAIALALQHLHVVATDCSAAALDIARLNAKRLQAKVSWVLSDHLIKQPPGQGYQLLISNPPYIPEEERPNLAPRIRDWEPQEALYVPTQEPLLHYQALGRWGQRLLDPRGWLLVETHAHYNHEVVALFKAMGYGSVASRKDLGGHARLVEARMASKVLHSI